VLQNNGYYLAGGFMMSDQFVYCCDKCHVVLADPDIEPGTETGLGGNKIEAWCPVCDTWREMSLVHIF
jgi:hypothetical protein